VNYVEHEPLQNDVELKILEREFVRLEMGISVEQLTAIEMKANMMGAARARWDFQERDWSELLNLAKTGYLKSKMNQPLLDIPVEDQNDLAYLSGGRNTNMFAHLLSKYQSAYALEMARLLVTPGGLQGQEPRV